MPMPKTWCETKLEELKAALKSMPLRTREGRRFAKRVYLLSKRIAKPIDVVGLILYELKMDLKTDSVTEAARDVKDVLETWFGWLYSLGLTCDMAIVGMRVDNYAAKVPITVCIEDRIWDFVLTLNGKVLYPELWGFYIRK